MIKYPMSFQISTDSVQGIQTSWKVGTPNQDTKIQMAIPPEFEGPGSGFSPEDIYAIALQNCFVATFKVFAEKSKVSFESLSGAAVLTVDRDEQGKPWMARIDLKFHLTGVEKEEAARRLLEKTSQSCMILNSVKTEKTFEFRIN